MCRRCSDTEQGEGQVMHGLATGRSSTVSVCVCGGGGYGYCGVNIGVGGAEAIKIGAGGQHTEECKHSNGTSVQRHNSCMYVTREGGYVTEPPEGHGR